ncbi:MAG: hypothetical protein ACRYGO_07405 [Janthinobacterium lividum]
MTQLISVQKWLGLRGEPISPESIQFTTRPAKSCRGCLFDGQHAAVCDRACQAAERAELEHCERGFIYVSKPVDPRQVSLLEKEH